MSTTRVPCSLPVRSLASVGWSRASRQRHMCLGVLLDGRWRQSGALGLDVTVPGALESPRTDIDVSRVVEG